MQIAIPQLHFQPVATVGSCVSKQADQGSDHNTYEPPTL